MAESVLTGADSLGAGDSRTLTAAHTTAHKLNKQYADAGAVSGSADKSAARADDGYVTLAGVCRAFELPAPAGRAPADH